MQNRLYHNIMPRPRIRPTEQELRALYPAMMDRDIAERFGVGRRTVTEWRELYKIDGVRRQPVRRYFRRRAGSLPVNDAFFECIDTEEKAYFLGLLSADGYVTKAGKQLALSLQSRDEHILHDMKRAMGAAHPVRDRKAGGFPGSGAQRLLLIGSKKLVSDLAKYGIVNGKSKKLTYPDLPAHLERHFARGAFDGDGHIRAVPKRLFYFLGTEAFVDGLRDAIIRHTGVALKKNEARGCWRISGYGGSAEVMRWLYQDSTVFLHRKKAVFLEHWQ